MAKRHNEFGRLLGTVENDIRPLKEQIAIPPHGVPDLNNMAADCHAMADQLHKHGDHLGAMAAMQPDWTDIVGNSPQEDIGLPISGY